LCLFIVVFIAWLVECTTMLIVYCTHALTWFQEHIWEVMHAYVIMHNIIIKSKRTSSFDDHSYDCQCPLAIVDHDMPANIADVLAMHVKIHDVIVRRNYKIIS
jgi:inorganic pyrophosphatase/exopolyphosphatase